MRIVNIDALEEQCINIPEYSLFVQEILEKQSHRLNRYDFHILKKREFDPDGLKEGSLIRLFDNVSIKNIANLFHTIPIYLRDSCPHIKDERVRKDTLGAYSPAECGEPYIELYVNAMNGNQPKIDLKYLFAFVLLHELAHALLDHLNNVRFLDCKEKIPYFGGDEDVVAGFGRYREEALANAVALKLIGDCDSDCYNAAIDFATSVQNNLLI